MRKDDKILYVPNIKKTLKDGFIVFITAILSSTLIMLISTCVNMALTF